MAAKKPPKPPEDGPDEGVDVRDDRTASMFGASLLADGAGSGGGPQAYQVLARKYRPTTFDDLVGQEAMVRTLTNAFKTGRIAHAFMLTGVRGVGKTTTARLLARALNYETETVRQPSITLDPPGVHCAAIMTSQHPDVLELDAASRTGVADMRDLLDGSRYAPVTARYKVYIIDEVHMLSTAAFNALLKTLEEPPPHVKFIFATTEIRRVPVTVLSRCQRFNLQRFSTEALAQHLAAICGKEGVSAEPEALALIARAAEGSARDALSILDQAISSTLTESTPGDAVGGGDGTKAHWHPIQVAAVRDMLGLADRSRVLDLMEKAVAGDHKAALVEAEALLEAGADAAVLIKDLMDVSVEVSRAKAMGEAYSYAGPADWKLRTQAMAQKLSPAQASRLWKLLLQGFEDCSRAPDPAMAAQMVVLRLAAAAALPPPEDAGRASRGEAPAPRQTQPAPDRQPASPPAGQDDHAPAGPRISTFKDVIAELEARRELALRYDIEQYVRPAEIGYGVFRYAAAPGAPGDLSFKIKTWLETVSGVEWQVSQSGGGVAQGGATGAAESPGEQRRRRKQEGLASASAHPRVAEALKVFQGARVLRVDDPAASEDYEEPAGASNVVHVDFAGQGRQEKEAPPDYAFEFAPPPEEDDD